MGIICNTYLKITCEKSVCQHKLSAMTKTIDTDFFSVTSVKSNYLYLWKQYKRNKVRLSSVSTPKSEEQIWSYAAWDSWVDMHTETPKNQVIPLLDTVW